MTDMIGVPGLEGYLVYAPCRILIFQDNGQQLTWAPFLNTGAIPVVDIVPLRAPLSALRHFYVPL